MQLATHLSCSDRTVRNHQSLIGMPTSQTGLKIIAPSRLVTDLRLIIKTYTQKFLFKKEVLGEASTEVHLAYR